MINYNHSVYVLSSFAYLNLSSSDAAEEETNKCQIAHKVTEDEILFRQILDPLPGQQTIKTEERIEYLLKNRESILKKGLTKSFKRIEDSNKKKIITYQQSKKGGKIYGLIGHFLGKGKYKKAKIAIELNTLESFVRLTSAHTTMLNREVKTQNLFRGDPEFVQILDSSDYYSRHKHLIKCQIITEFCDNGNLADFIKDAEESEMPHFVTIFHDVLLGLVKMQDKGILHRDIKSDNIFLTFGRERIIHAKIGDFGFACSQEQQRNSIRKGDRFCAAGTPFYSSPEYFIGTYNKERASILIKNFVEEINISVIHEYLKDSQGFMSIVNGESEFDKKDITEEQMIDHILQNRAVPLFVEARQKLNAYKRVHQYMIDYVENGSSTKNDLWSFGLMVYESLYNNYFYNNLFISKPIRNLNDFFEFLCLTSQEEIDAKIFQKHFDNPIKNKMQKILKEILVLDPKMRPDAKKIYALYCDEFGLTRLI